MPVPPGPSSAAGPGPLAGPARTPGRPPAVVRTRRPARERVDGHRPVRVGPPGPPWWAGCSGQPAGRLRHGPLPASSAPSCRLRPGRRRPPSPGPVGGPARMPGRPPAVVRTRRPARERVDGRRPVGVGPPGPPWWAGCSGQPAGRLRHGPLPASRAPSCRHRPGRRRPPSPGPVGGAARTPGRPPAVVRTRRPPRERVVGRRPVGVGPPGPPQPAGRLRHGPLPASSAPSCRHRPGRRRPRALARWVGRPVRPAGRPPSCARDGRRGNGSMGTARSGSGH
jgi:hypothetical protein